MRTLVILFLLFIFQNCNTKDFPSEIKKIYSLNKDKTFSEFENRNIYPREEKRNVYLFDYILNEKIAARYLVVANDSIVFKQIFPLQDTVFYLLNKDTLYSHLKKPIISLDLFLNFKSLGIDAIFYRQKERLFLLKKDKNSLIRLVDPRNNLSDSINFINYQKIDQFWFYFKSK